MIGSIQIGVGLADDGYSFEEEGLNTIQLALGVTAFAAGGWIAVAAGAVSIGIAVYAETVNGQPVCQ
ncbi:hypothetical protein QM480_04480 [Flectobacillus sp. DC10W]|uniref:Uncharacterized protein n=1 Tax=Flectobacillus longus TaxID=2984207 RepID=A0ABT6YIZ4_9BACT|nr:hypothetical protein [Flectobacillus longus]MDI9863565.1 hypothetical protein [Flectobacillus longus]